MERSDLLRQTAASFAIQGRAVAETAAADVRVIVVGNPANTNCLVARHAAPDVPADRWTALLRLDHNRLRSQLARKLDVPLSAITHTSVWGNHSSTMVPDVWHALVDGQPAIEQLDDAWISGSLIPTIQQRGAAVMQASGASSAASAASAVAEEVTNLHSATSDWISPGVMSRGEYGIPEGLHVGLPATVHNGQINIIHDLDLTREQRSLLDRSVDELVAERDQALALADI